MLRVGAGGLVGGHAAPDSLPLPPGRQLPSPLSLDWLPPTPQVLGLLNNVASRRFEFQADAFGVGLGKGAHLREALLVLDKENKVGAGGGWEGRVMQDCCCPDTALQRIEECV